MEILNEIKSVNGLKLCDETARKRIDNLVLGKVDLSDYYTKTQVDTKIQEVTSVDFSNYYTKEEVYTKGEIDDQLGLIEDALSAILGGE